MEYLAREWCLRKLFSSNLKPIFVLMSPEINPIRVAIVDDHQLIIDGVLALLSEAKHIHVVLATTSPVEIINRLNSVKVDVLITDILMPEMNGDALAKAVKAKFPAIKILVLSMSGQGAMINDMINDADVCGYALKNIGKEELIGGIEKIAAGGIFFGEEVLQELDKYCAQKKAATINITAREKEIIRLIEKEHSNKEIADILSISERTVETHRKNIFRKTNTHNVVGLIKYAYESKII